MSDEIEMATCQECGATAPRADMFGIQDDLRCPDCAQGIRKRMQTRVRPPMRKTTFLATKIVLGISLVLFVATDLVYRGKPLPGWLIGLYQQPDIWAGEWWRHIGATFLHGGWWHILLNGFAFWQLGRLIEAGWGSLTLAGLVVLTGAGSSAAGWVLNAPVGGVGLSGAIFALAGFMLAQRRTHAVAAAVMTKQNQNMIWAMIGLGFVLSWTGSLNVGNTAHVSGLGLGFLAGMAWQHKQRKALVPLVALLCVGLVVAAQFLTLSSAKVPMEQTFATGEKKQIQFSVEQYRTWWLDQQAREGR